jgi:hypothetical protein
MQNTYTVAVGLVLHFDSELFDVRKSRNDGSDVGIYGDITDRSNVEVVGI